MAVFAASGLIQLTLSQRGALPVGMQILPTSTPSRYLTTAMAKSMNRAPPLLEDKIASSFVH